MENTTFPVSNQDYVLDKSSILMDVHPVTGKIIDWRFKKLQTDRMADACRRIAVNDIKFQDRFSELSNCGSYLEFKKSENEKKLHKAFFCKYRLCPMCNWRKSLKHFSQLSDIMNKANNDGYRFLFATMSIKNCSGYLLGDQITSLNLGYTNLIRRKRVQKAIKGTMKTIEVTRNTKPSSPAYLSYNVHIHALFAVQSSYFKTSYTKHSVWLDFWRKSMKVNYTPHFHIKAVKSGNENGAIREVAKYATKSTDILVEDDDMTDEAILHLDAALHNRRLISYTGILKNIKHDLNLDDVETGDLININANQITNSDLLYTIERYRWNYGYSQYFKI